MTHTCTDTIPQIATKPLVLATDLDGTFLGGGEKARQGLYRWIENNRDSVGLIFVTGRNPQFVSRLARSAEVPAPDYVVGDVGTTIGMMDHTRLLTPIEALEADIAKAWKDAGERVKSALKNVRGLQLQTGGFRYRVSYDMDPTTFDKRAFDIVAQLGLDALVSDNRFFDVLPKGVSKGPSLLRLIDHLGIDSRRCLVAGDTLNDLSMIELGLPAVVVGNSEEHLVDRVADLDHVHVAKGHGAAGIAEAILAFEFFNNRAA